MNADHEPVVGLRELVKEFGAFRAVDGLSMTVERGQVHGFLGPNGAGKSTTLRVLLGLYRRTAGEVSVLGLDPESDAPEATRRISYVPGEVALWPNLTGQEVLDALAGIRGAYDRDRERELVAAFALDPRRKIRTYSKGNRQKVMLVAAFSARTDLLVLDEPSSGLDPLMEELFQQCVRDAVAAGRTVLLSSHVLDEVEKLCDAVTIIKDGRLVESGRVAEMRHLAASRITGSLTRDLVDAAGLALGAAGLGDLDGAVGADGAVDMRVSATEVNAALAALIQVGVRELACTPATLDDMFLRHYKVAAR